MKVTDYIVEFLISKGITDVFGYPGGVVCHLIESIEKYKGQIEAHSGYHEQASSFSACGYAQASQKPGVAYATSGPGATNLITGISNAYYDSIPTIFLTGQVDTHALKGDLNIRQKGFQETDIVSMVKGVTKYCSRIDSPDDVQKTFEEAYRKATEGRPGPVLIDLPANIQRSDIEITQIKNETDVINNPTETLQAVESIICALNQAKKPCLLLGAGVKQSGLESQLKKIIDVIQIPVTSSLLAFDILPYSHPLTMGFIGSNGQRYGNFVLAKCDLVITLGSRLDLKQTGGKRENFAPNAKIIRVDIDTGELSYKSKDSETQIHGDIKEIIPALLKMVNEVNKVEPSWVSECQIIKEKLIDYDKREPHEILSALSKKVSDNVSITTDVGQNQVWIPQAFQIKENQSVYCSGGHGAMGYSLPASIGVHYATKKPVISFNGDGGLQMNIQELEFIKREQIPITVVVINNYSLGMIRHFQEMNFDENYIHTTRVSGYSAPDFSAIANAYSLQYKRVTKKEDIESLELTIDKPSILEICLPIDTYLEPKFGYNKPNHDQEPFLGRELFNYLNDQI